MEHLRGLPELDALRMQIPLTTGLPSIPSNLITSGPPSLMETLESTNCNGLLAPTIAKISKSDRTCNRATRGGNEEEGLNRETYIMREKQTNVNYFPINLPFRLARIH